MMKSTLFEPTRHAGLARLKSFIASAGRDYQSTRNADLGPTDRSNVSALSPYIRHRLITEEEVLCAVLNKHTTAAAEKFIQEVFWRSYFKGHLETKPAIWRNYCAALDGLKIQGGLAKAYKAAIIGQSGIDCFDAWVAELIEFGYLHNHARMWFASIWIFTLRLPWELGADFMYRHLLDGDPASNTLSWRWVAGLHTKGKTYLARPDNIETYTQGRFSPTSLARDAVALEEPALPQAQKISHMPESYSGGKIGLLLTEEDLHSESWSVDEAQVVAVAGTLHADACDLVTQFKADAVKDGVRRASDKFGVPGEILERLDSEHILTWAKSHNVETIVTAYAPVGPVAEALAQLKLPDIKFVQLRRAFDSAAWPNSTKGFFAMKEKIPDLLRRIIDTNHPQLSLI